MTTSHTDQIRAIFLEIAAKDRVTALDCNFLAWCYGFDIEDCYEAYDDLVYSGALVSAGGGMGWKVPKRSPRKVTPKQAYDERLWERGILSDSDGRIDRIEFEGDQWDAPDMELGDTYLIVYERGEDWYNYVGAEDYHLDFEEAQS